MAERTFFIPRDSFPYFEEKTVIFEYFPGFALSQQQKSINSMHDAIAKTWSIGSVLEVSTKSESAVGVALSAFNLMLYSKGHGATVESVYQSSKVFTKGGPYLDIALKSSMDAKKDERLKSSGDLLHFEHMGAIWPLVQSPNFYDFLYISALCQSSLVAQIDDYEAFSDFAYSTRIGKAKKGKSWNCQARSIAIFRGISCQVKQSEVLENLRELALDASRELKHEPLTLF